MRPTIVIFNPDSYRGDVLGHLGNPGAVTPHLDAIVNDGGVSYANAFAQNPVCTPSRCSFMTGWYPHVHGHRSMKNMLKPHTPNLVAELRRALTELIDLPSTLFDLLDIEPGYAVQGRSLRDSLAGDDREIRDAVFAEVGSRKDDRAFKNLDVLPFKQDSRKI
jgi:arylsulfatase A-like enzyme